MDPSVPSDLWQLEPDVQRACENLAQLLESTTLNRVVTSEMLKAKETGQFIADRLGIPCQSAPNLHDHERTGVPFMSEETWLQTLTSFFEKQDKLVFGTETATQAIERFDGAVRQVLKHYPGETLAICSHSTVMSLFIAHYNSVNLIDLWQNLKMPDVVALDSSTFKRLDWPLVKDAQGRTG